MKKLFMLLFISSSLTYASSYTKCAGCYGDKGEKAAMNSKSKIIKDMTKAEIKTAMVG